MVLLLLPKKTLSYLIQPLSPVPNLSLASYSKAYAEEPILIHAVPDGKPAAAASFAELAGFP